MSVTATDAAGVLAVAALGAAWVLVQSAWRRTFPGASPDPDPLAHRRGCRGGCDNQHDCDRHPSGGIGPVGEENR